MVGLHVALLGGFQARLSSGTPVSLPTKKAQALVAYLGVRPGQRHSRDKVAALLWGEKSDDHARGALRHVLVSLRRSLADTTPPALLVESQALALNAASVEVDVAAFERRVAEGNPEALEQAAEIYRGDLLLGFTLHEPLFDDWLIAERERLRELALEALARGLAHQTRSANTERAIQTAVRLLTIDPLQETVHRALMQLYARQGRRGAALRQYQICVDVLRTELGTEPEPETRTLYQDLLRRVPAGVASSAASRDPRVRPVRAVTPPPPELPPAATPLFGRQTELTRLGQALDDAIRGHGHVATVIGEAGVGKTRLVTALAADALSRGCRVMIGHCHESDSILSFGPWVDACRSGGVAGDETLLGALHPTRRSELARLLPEAGGAGLPRASDGALPLFESVVAVIEQLAARQPLVLVLEDLHWADEMSLRLLSFVNRRIPEWPVMLLAVARAEELADSSMARRLLKELSLAPGALTVQLLPLSRSDTALLVRALARAGSNAPTVTRVEAQVWAMSEGNPFVVVEAMRTLDQGSLAPVDDGRPGTLAVPASVRDLVVRRLERLAPRSQELIAVAAVIGRRFDFRLLSRACGGVDEREAAQAVEEMVRHHVLQTVGNQLDFVHDRLRDVTYSGLMPLRRRILHRGVAEAIEAMRTEQDGAATPSEDRRDDQVEQLAHHAVRGELGETAVRYLRQAGAKALTRAALQDARAWLDQALDVLQTLAESRSTLEEAFEVRLELRTVLSQLGEFRQALVLLGEAEALAERLHDDGRRGRVYSFMASVQARLEDPDQAIASGQRALEIAERLGDAGLRALTMSHLGLAHHYRGEYARVVELTRATLAALPAERLHDFSGDSQPVAVNSRFRLLACLAHLGRFGETAEHEAEIVRLAEQTQQPYPIGLAYHAASMPHLIKGNWTTAHALIERQIAAWRAGNVVDELPMTLAFSARVLAHLGKTVESLDRLLESERRVAERSARGRIGLANVYFSLGHASLVLGRLDQAQELGGRALASRSGRIDYVPYTLHLLGDLATRPERLDARRAEAYYREALALATLRGMRPLVAHCHHGLGTLSARVDETRRAREHLTIATEMYRDMGMQFWLEQVEAEAGRLV